MSRRSSGLSSIRNDSGQPPRPQPGHPAVQGVTQPLAFRLPPFDPLHPIESLRQRRMVKQHQTSLLMELLDRDRKAYVERVAQDDDGDRHAYRLGKFRDRIAAEDDLAEALAEGQTKLTAIAQHYQRLTAINTDNQISLIGELIKDPVTKRKITATLQRQAANTFVELEALAMNDNLKPGSGEVTG